MALLMEWPNDSRMLSKAARGHPVEQIWSRIESWLAASAPSVHASFGPPATKRELAKTEQFLGVQFPDDVRFSYLRHNGNGLLFGAWSWLSLKGIRNYWSSWKSLLDDGTFEGQKTTNKGSKVRNDWWNPAWIPLVVCESDSVCLDLAPGRKGRVGQMIQMWHDLDQRYVEAASFKEWLSGYADDLERGKYVEYGDALESRITLCAMLGRRGRRRLQQGWPFLLELACEFGWNQADADEYSILGTDIKAADALAMATALERALKAIPKGKAACLPAGASRAMRFFSGTGRIWLADFVKYCKRGAFETRIDDHLYAKL